MDGRGSPPNLQEGTLCKLPKLAFVTIIMTNFGGKLSNLNYSLQSSVKLSYVSEKSAEKGPLFTEFWA